MSKCQKKLIVIFENYMSKILLESTFLSNLCIVINNINKKKVSFENATLVNYRVNYNKQ